MSSPATLSEHLSAEDAAFIAGVPAGILHRFRDETIADAFIHKHPTLFLGTDWVQPHALRKYLRDSGLTHEDPVFIASSPPAMPKTRPTRRLSFTKHVKEETSDFLDLTKSYGKRVKVERSDDTIIDLSSSPKTRPVKVQTRSLKEGNRDVVEILSSDDEIMAEEDGDAENDNFTIANNGFILPKSEKSVNNVIPEADGHGAGKSAREAHWVDKILSEIEELPLSDTNWLEDGVHSRFKIGSFKVTRELKVERVEYLSKIPSFWPIPRVPTAYVLDLRGPEFTVVEKGKIVSPDALIKNKDQDCWTGGTGKGDSTANILLFGTPVTCRRSRLRCRGAFACSQVDEKLLDVERYELDPEARAAIFAADMETRRQVGLTVEDTVITFWNVIQSRPCRATDKHGDRCTGKPRLVVSKIANRGKKYFIGCSGWRKDSQDGHQSFSIPDGVDEKLLVKVFKEEGLVDYKKDAKCSRVISPHIGLKIKYCVYPHVSDDGQPFRSPICHRECLTKRATFIPEAAEGDYRLRIAVVVPECENPHNHPMPPPLKFSFDIKATYVQCIEGHGTLGATVRKVDNASSSCVILKGKTPGQFHPSMLQSRKKRDLIQEVKKNLNPFGLGIAGVWELYTADMAKPLCDRYIHSIIGTGNGGIIILTFQPYLAKLIHEAVSFEVDTTFKRAVGELNEWELVIWYAALSRTVTIGRVYTNRADREFYKALFDECQKVLLLVTGKPMRFKRLSKGGNLLAMNVDLEAAQVLGAGDSFLPTNEPDYSGIHTTEAEVIVQYFTKACYAHVKRPIHDFKAFLSDEDYKYVMDFPYMKSDEEIQAFTAFCRASQSKKIRDWWEHKLQHRWILPAIIQVKSKIHAEDWRTTPMTTNAGEAQHHWTNQQTGTRLSLLEAIQSARGIDNKTADDIQSCIRNGILTNPNNDTFQRMSRQVQRHTKAVQKGKVIAERNTAVERLREQVSSEKNMRKESSERQKALQQELKATQASTSRTRAPRAVKSRKSMQSDAASSSGRVASSSSSKEITRAIVDPYPIERTMVRTRADHECGVATDLSNLAFAVPSSSNAMYGMSDNWSQIAQSCNYLPPQNSPPLEYQPLTDCYGENVPDQQIGAVAPPIAGYYQYMNEHRNQRDSIMAPPAADYGDYVYGQRNAGMIAPPPTTSNFDQDVHDHQLYTGDIDPIDQFMESTGGNVLYQEWA